MIEILESYESLESTLDLRDRLDQVKEPLEVIAVVSEAIRCLGVWQQEKNLERLQIQVTDRLQDIHTQVTVLYKEVVIPRDYGWWWEKAQQELDAKKLRYSDALEQLRTMPSESKLQRRKVRETQFGVSTFVSHEEYEASVNDPVAFAAWKQKMEGWMQETIDDSDHIRQRLTANAPIRKQDTV